MKRADEDSFIQVYDQYADDIFRYCYFRVYDREKARDLMQEAFTKTWEYLQNGKRIDNMRAFLYRTAHNLTVNEQVRSTPLSLEELAEDGFDPEETGYSPEQVAEHGELLRLVEKLTDKDREVITLRYLSGLPVSEIAQLLGESANTISVRIHRALNVLKDTYQSYD